MPIRIGATPFTARAPTGPRYPSTIALLARPDSGIVNHQITHDQHGKEPVSDSAGFGVVLAFGPLVLNWLAIRYIDVVAWLASF
ncbi:hypothetical protein FJV76_30145 [Mesorhizobium sp. WSM4303]|uniref:hypothetical protein n=1 Tax=unclassified Mesorhizobium TaxID=325217 RepID=UPI00115DA073|nr:MULTISPECIES: hypothetical protein [unclassified Mesorhizobium]TRC85243.1 hypothetical protein FJV77_31625 [Mesorhizobium sp. WSM4306]TRC94948.1 hypothetical protein FJV76_30145 [Mesorhizobium sp. WSM4303]